MALSAVKALIRVLQGNEASFRSRFDLFFALICFIVGHAVTKHWIVSRLEELSVQNRCHNTSTLIGCSVVFFFFLPDILSFLGFLL